MYKEYTYEEGINRLPEVLTQMGFSSFRPGQEAPVKDIMQGNDSVCILATGGGKTAIFTIPAIAMNWSIIVFSPLVALMRDQEQSLNRKGIKAASVNSKQDMYTNTHALQDWQRGNLQVLYVAPERINDAAFLAAANLRKPDMVVVDEAHCISQWSDTFRPAYVQCGDFIKTYNPKVVVAVTATATNKDIEDIKEKLHIEQAHLHRYYVPRLNLNLHGEVVMETNDIYRKTLNAVRSVKGSCIVYCQTIEDVENYTKYLADHGESVTFYHGKMYPPQLKDINQDQFMSGRARICVATNAFGMGIDKPDIECVVHTNPPGSIEAVQQEIGRAARDGREAHCYMFMSMRGASMQEYFWNKSNPDSFSVRAAYAYLTQICPSDGVINITVATLAEKIGSTCADGVLFYLESRGCVIRTKNNSKVYTFKDPGEDIEKFSKATRPLVEVIRNYGLKTGTEENCTVYKLDLDFMLNKLGGAESTLKSKIRQIQKDNHILNVPPFRGTSTKLVKAPTDEDVAYADQRRKAEWDKIQKVREYIICPDKQKHTFLQSYFEVN